MVLPGVYSVMVPPPVVVVVVVVVSDVVCAYANGAASANVMLSIVFFMVVFWLRIDAPRCGISRGRLFDKLIDVSAARGRVRHLKIEETLLQKTRQSERIRVRKSG